MAHSSTVRETCVDNLQSPRSWSPSNRPNTVWELPASTTSSISDPLQPTHLAEAHRDPLPAVAHHM